MFAVIKWWQNLCNEVTISSCETMLSDIRTHVCSCMCRQTDMHVRTYCTPRRVLKLTYHICSVQDRRRQAVCGQAPHVQGFREQPQRATWWWWCCEYIDVNVWVREYFYMYVYFANNLGVCIDKDDALMPVCVCMYVYVCVCVCVQKCTCVNVSFVCAWLQVCSVSTCVSIALRASHCILRTYICASVGVLLNIYICV